MTGSDGATAGAKPLASARWLAAALLTFVVSTSNAVQSRVNGAASEAVSEPTIAAMMSVGGGLAAALTLTLLVPGARCRLLNLVHAGRERRLAWWNYLAGMGGGLFILGQATVVPVYGVTLYMVAVVAGQSASSLLVDRLAIGTGPRRLITLTRVLAACLALLGAVLIGIARPQGIVLAVAGLAWGLGAGGATAVQYALNGLIARETGSTLVTSVLNFLAGFTLLTGVLAISVLVRGHQIAPPPSPLETPLLWLGGPLGLLFIASAAYLVRVLGVLAFTVTSVAGQLTGALVLDAVLPTSGSVLNAGVIAGFGAALAGVVLAARARRSEA